jgi:c-di-GMP-binding flagellar brake protein YcgR
MERRKEARSGINREVTLTVLGEADGRPFQAVAVEMSGSGMRILSPTAVPYQAAVKVEAGDVLLLGEVIRVQASDGGHMLAVKLRHSLDSLSDLHRLHQALQWESQPIDVGAL